VPVRTAVVRHNRNGSGDNDRGWTGSFFDAPSRLRAAENDGPTSPAKVPRFDFPSAADVTRPVDNDANDYYPSGIPMATIE